jgi:hypothetical protein
MIRPCPKHHRLHLSDDSSHVDFAGVFSGLGEVIFIWSPSHTSGLLPKAFDKRMDISG